MFAELRPVAKPGISCNCWMITQENSVIKLNFPVLTFSFICAKTLNLNLSKHIGMPVEEQINAFYFPLNKLFKPVLTMEANTTAQINIGFTTRFIILGW